MYTAFKKILFLWKHGLWCSIYMFDGRSTLIQCVYCIRIFKFSLWKDVLKPWKCFIFTYQSRTDSKVVSQTFRARKTPHGDWFPAVEKITFYTLTSISIFSILFTIHLLWYWQGEFIQHLHYQISSIILLTFCHTTLIMLVWRIKYLIY